MEERMRSSILFFRIHQRDFLRMIITLVDWNPSQDSGNNQIVYNHSLMLRFYQSCTLMFILLLGLSSCNQEKAAMAVVPEVGVVLPVIDTLEVKRDFVGQIYGASDVPIRARVDGFLNDIMFQEGRRVFKNQLLYVIDPLPSEQEVSASRSNYEEARANFIQADNDLERIKPLAEINAVSQSDLDAAIANRKAAAKRVEAAKANLNLSEINLGYTEIRAPIDGVIGKTGVEIGEYVGGGLSAKTLNTVSRIDTMRVEFFLTEEDYLAVVREVIAQRRSEDSVGRSGDETLPLELILADQSIFDYTGTVSFLDRGVDPTTGTILLQAEFPNPDRLLRPGQFAKVRATMESIPDAMLIPYRCIIQTQSVNSVKLVDESGNVELRTVEIGAVQGDMIRIVSGLKPDDKVIITGMQLARDGMPAKAEMVEFESQRAN